LISVWLMAFGVRADEAQARELFGAGAQAMLERNWSQAVRLLEASLAHKDKPACRFNLVVANREIERPLEVARHALAFLATVEGRSHSEETAEVRTFLAAAQRELVTLQLEGLPLGAQPTIDDAPPRVSDGSRIYELPGRHRLELWLGERQLESIEIELSAGAVQPWPRVRSLRASAESATTGDEREAPVTAGRPQTGAANLPHEAPMRLSGTTRKKLAWTLGLTGAATGLAALASYGYVARRADALRSLDASEPGYTTTAADRYGRAKNSVMPLAFTSGALMASATALVEHKPRAALAVSIAALVAGLAATGVGAVLLARTPAILIEDTEVTRPSREAGSLCVGAALPLLTYGARLQWDMWRASGVRER
jgi:hypothetical protein